MESEMESILSLHLQALCKINIKGVDELENSDSLKYPDDFYSKLLDDSLHILDNELIEFTSSLKHIYPSYPLYLNIVKNLCRNKDSGHSFSICQSDEFNEITDWDVFNRKIQILFGIIRDLLKKKSEEHKMPNSSFLVENISGVEKKQEIDLSLLNILKTFSKFDWLNCLGLKRTVGSVEILPPDISTLWISYQKLHHPKSKLTVGARALSKHCGRSLDHWWGRCTGSELDKNKHAVEILKIILSSSTWLNVHTLPHDVLVLEVRCGEGYGMRWTHDGELFRGFLEPQMMDGHEKGWVH